MKQQFELCLDTALRLAAIGTMPHAVARVILLYHQTLYRVLQTFIPCDICSPHGVVLEQVKKSALKLDKQRVYYQSHLELFGKEALLALLRADVVQLNLSMLCDPCLDNLQHELTNAFQAELAKQRITCHIRPKKGSAPAR